MRKEHEDWRLFKYISVFHLIKNMFKNPALFNRILPSNL